MENNVYRGLDQIPNGTASDHITEGCVVLEGGAFRGLYTQGVLDAFMEADINFSCTVGVSAGAMSGMNYVSGQIGRSARINLKYRHDERYVSTHRFLEYGGVINFDFVLKHVPEDPLDVDRFMDDRRRFVAVATNCLNGKPEFFEKGKCTDIYKAIQASASMPYVSRMVNIDGQPYLDGGCSVKIPYEWAMTQGYEKIVVIRTRAADYRNDLSKNNRLAPRLYRHHPQLAYQLGRMNENYNRACDRLERLHDEGRLFLISPSQPVTIDRLEKDMDKLGDLYTLGYEDGKQALGALRSYLEK